MQGPPLGSGKLIAEYDAAEVVLVFVVLPVLLGGFTVGMAVRVAVEHAAELTAAEWLFQVVGAGLLGLAAMACLPVVAWPEFRRRRAAR